jgi:hypothetical protein
LALAVAPFILAGCGLAGSSGGPGVTLTVTRDFGTRSLLHLSVARAPASETALEMLRKRFAVGTGAGGQEVESIDGVAGGRPSVNWSLYVNGVQTGGRTLVRGGDHVWWDLHDWTATRVTRAVVGSYPAPFVGGLWGKRLPTTVECASDVGPACRDVQHALNAARIPFASQYIGTGSGSDTLGIVVGTWRDVQAEVAAALIAHGPSASGVYARFTTRGALQLLDSSGNVVKTLTSGGGLVAATADSQSAPTWLITGTDPAGVAAAARAVNAPTLHNRFAVAVASGKVIPIPAG